MYAEDYDEFYTDEESDVVVEDDEDEFLTEELPEFNGAF